VFINPEFSLFQASRNLPIILSSQLNRFLKKLDAVTRAPQERHRNCASQLLSADLEETPYSRLPSYNYEQLKRGFICSSCRSFDVFYLKNVLICDECGHKETIESAILRSTEEYSLLFPERKITTKAIHDWCGLFKTKKPVLRTLSSNYKVMGCGKSSYFLPS
jgi:hypothetical protein